MVKIVRIGTRDSKLALWQAHKVAEQLKKYDVQSEIVPIKSRGDIDLEKPLYEFGITGVFTKALDVALIEKKIDIAVHSMKDVPTALPKKIKQIAVLKRDAPWDVLALRKNNMLVELPDGRAKIATGSLRRKAFLLNKFPFYEIEPIRGNVHTRIEKLNNSLWDGVVFSTSGLKRMELNVPLLKLDFIIPAPAQGTIMIAGHEDNYDINKMVSKLNHRETEICTTIERDFLRKMEGGCSAPIGAIAIITGKLISFKAAVVSLDGKEKVEISKEFIFQNSQSKGEDLAMECLANGGEEIMEKIKLSE